MNKRLQQQIEFLMEIDKLKQVFRQTYLLDESRKENDAEHSWHFSMLAVVLCEYADAPVDVLKVIKMALVHDLVEIDAGDTFLYDEVGNRDKAEREQKAANRLFGLLPEDQGRELRALWDEFEAKETPEAQFAGAIDRLQPLLHNLYTEGRAWREHNVTVDMVIDLNSVIADGSRELWAHVKALIDEAAAKGHIERKQNG